ncbi:MAG: hypothetical protein ACRELC_02765, partial [Gemmatimonadota bacterium]
LLGAALALGAATLVASPAMAQEQPAPRTISGQVVDMTCYLNMGLKGADHKQCAELCAKAGLQLGILGSDGRLYLATDQGMPAPDVNPKLIPFAEEQVRVTGVVNERSGARSIVIDRIEKAG